MALPIDPLWSEDRPDLRYVPSDTDKADGFPCGTENLRETLNWLFWFFGKHLNDLTVDLRTAPGSADLLNPEVMLVEARRAIGVTNRAMTSSFQEWRLNSVVQNEIAGASLSGSTYYVTLPPGRYNALYAGSARDAGSHVCRLYNRSTGTEIGHGLNSDSRTGDNPAVTPSIGATTFTLTETTQISLDHASLVLPTGSSFGEDNLDIARTDAFLRLEREKGV